LRWSAEEFGKGSSYYLNGDEIATTDELAEELIGLNASFSRDAGIKRLLIDEITAVPGWDKAVTQAFTMG
jgi:predicted AAA+ superfamily ATPase